MMSTRQNDRFELESGTKSAGKEHHTKWIDNLNFRSTNNISSESAVTTSKDTTVAGGDDVMLVGINVQRDVRVEHGPL